MSLPQKQNLPSSYTQEWIEYDRLYKLGSQRSQTSNLSFTSSSSGMTYTSNTGQEGILQQLQVTLNPYLISSSDYNLIDEHIQEVKDIIETHKADYEYKPATVVGRQIRIPKQSNSARLPFKLVADIMAGAPLTVSDDGGATSKPLVDSKEEPITELEKGYLEVIADATFFTLKSSGGVGLKEFFGDGFDGIFDLSLIPPVADLSEAIATNLVGAGAQNVLDGNTATKYTAASGAARDLFVIDFGKDIWASGITLSGFTCSASFSLVMQVSDDGVNYVTLGAVVTGALSEDTVNLNFTVAASYRFRYLKLRQNNATTTVSIGTITLPKTSNNHIIVSDEPYVKIEAESINIPPSTTLTMLNPCQGLVLYSKGDITINGTVSMTAKAGLLRSTKFRPMPLLREDVDFYNILASDIEPIRGGSGGNGGGSGVSAYAAPGGIGGIGRLLAGGFGGGGSGGHTETGSNRGGTGGSILPIDTEICFNHNTDSNRVNGGAYTGLTGRNGQGGSGAGQWGGNTSYSAVGGPGGACLGAGGGGGGGARANNSAIGAAAGIAGAPSGGLILLIAKGNILINGRLESNGGNGGNGGAAASDTSVAGGGGGGGGAGGGVIVILHKGSVTNNGTIEVNGGAGGAAGPGTSAGYNGQPGTSGSVGTVHVQKI